MKEVLLGAALLIFFALFVLVTLPVVFCAVLVVLLVTGLLAWAGSPDER